jgi:exodeoxyribonuclease-3
VKDTRVANIDLANGNPIGSERFTHKLAWMDRLEANGSLAEE